MIDVNMGDDQRANMTNRKIDFQPVAPGVLKGFFSLKQPAIDQNARVPIETQLMAGPGYAVDSTVVLQNTTVHGWRLL